MWDALRGTTYPSRLEVLLHEGAEAAVYSVAMGGSRRKRAGGAGSDNNFISWAQGETLERREDDGSAQWFAAA